MPKKVGRPVKEERVPAGSDPSWEKVVQPVLEFLDRPRSWKELNAYMRKLRMSQHLFNNCLAWLEDHRKAFSSLTSDGVVVWSTVAGYRRSRECLRRGHDLRASERRPTSCRRR